MSNSLIVRRLTVGPFAENSYVLGCGEAAKGVLVDPGGEVPSLLQTAADSGLEIEALWLTHAHVDHIVGVREAVELTSAPVLLHADDRLLYEAACQQGEQVGMAVEQPPLPRQWMQGGETLSVGELRVEVLHVPGHSPGHVAFWLPADGVVFSGDCVFAGSIGRTDLPGGSYSTLMASIRDVIFGLGDDVRILPGHGPPTTVGRERQTNPFFSGAVDGGAM
ncbi:MAG: MBL fold metallo-hydrolase [Acidobacteriota bacterium]